MTKENHPPPGSNLGRAWTQLRRDRDRAVSISKQYYELLKQIHTEDDIPVRFSLRLDAINCQLANFLGAQRVPTTARPTDSDAHHGQHHEGETP